MARSARSVRYDAVHDVLLDYVASDDATWNSIYQAYDPGFVEQYYRYADPDGRKFGGPIGAILAAIRGH